MKKRTMLNLVLAAGLLTGNMLLAGWIEIEDVDVQKGCTHCGMDCKSYAFSRMMIEYDDGSIVPVCSLHCAAVDLARNIDKTPKTITVGDFNSRHMIDAEKAFWVVGGSKPGVMSKRGKWAFTEKDDAEYFIKSNGGSFTTFEEAIKASYLDTYEDTKMIRERRKMKRIKMMQQKQQSNM